MATFRATKLRARMEQLGLQHVEHVAMAVLAEAIPLTPVDTGELVQSLRARKIKKGVWRVGAHAPHALYIELGTQNGAAQPYLRPALKKVLGR